jgi:hypothetical protein
MCNFRPKVVDTRRQSFKEIFQSNMRRIELEQSNPQ